MLAQSLLVSAFAAVAVAQSVSKVLFFTKFPATVTVGDPTVLTYDTNDTSTPVTILLKQGIITELQTVTVLTDSAMDGQYIWNPAKSLVDGSNYALEIKQNDQFNYAGPIVIEGGSLTSSSSSASSYATMSATRNSSMTTTSSTSMGTGFGYPNATMHRNSTTSHTSTATTTSGSQTTPSGAGFQGTSSSSGTSPTTTGSASTFAAGGSAIALIFGAVAAMLFC